LLDPDGGPDGRAFVPCDETVAVPEGSFVMGRRGELSVDCSRIEGCALDGPLDATETDLLAHEVWVSGFWIERTEVTVHCYQVCVEAGDCEVVETGHGELEGYMTNPENADRPAIFIAWDQARSYCGLLGGRLPTEAEWEKAARGTDERRYPVGDEASCEQGDIGRVLGFGDCEPRDDELPLPVTARPLDLSPYGVQGMTGGVSEWVADFYDPAYYFCGGPPWIDPQGPESPPCAPDFIHMTRGGGWKDALTHRSDEPPGAPAGPLPATTRQLKSDDGYPIGVRCAWDAQP
jgi:formylglycine-generating enzyme required for sulfatase activity